ncbi:GntR family transcriptional regulator [Micromonospora sp. NPDC049230]|uniref:GntR family transcriptional regulator n=1 Tax=Micromonospora sp. NPDC049230 TaxID=3155502 RepID=UPI0033DD6EE8
MPESSEHHASASRRTVRLPDSPVHRSAPRHPPAFTTLAPPELAPGEKQPSTRELADQYGVHNSAISRVMAILKDRELVDGHPGKGVTSRKPRPERAASLIV